MIFIIYNLNIINYDKIQLCKICIHVKVLDMSGFYILEGDIFKVDVNVNSMFSFSMTGRHSFDNITVMSLFMCDGNKEKIPIELLVFNGGNI